MLGESIIFAVALDGRNLYLHDRRLIFNYSLVIIFSSVIVLLQCNSLFQSVYLWKWKSFLRVMIK